jgi:hypothetical protein
MKIVKLSVFILLIVSVVPMSAAEEKRFSNETHFSLVNTTGNSETFTVAGKMK